MNEVPPNPGEDDEVDDLYRRASALDASRPSESVRRAVLDHAARLAAQQPETGPVKIDFTRPAANQAWRRPAIFGTLAAAALAGLIVAPQFLTPRAPVAPASPPAPVSPPALAQNEDQLQDRISKRRAESSPAEAKNNLKPRADAEPGASSAEPAAEMAANNVPAKKTPSSADAPSAAGRQSSRAAQSLGTAQSSATAQNALTAQTSVGAVSSPAAPSLPAAPNSPAAPSPLAAPSLAGARSSAMVQSADKAQVTDNVQSSPGPQDAVTAQNSERRKQGVTSSISAFSAPPHAAASMAPAARLADPSAELRRAAEVGDLSALQVLVDKQPETEIDARDPSGRTALMLATLHGQIQAVEVLLAHGADPNAADGRGTSPLQAAIAGNQSAIAAALRRAGAR